MASSQSVALASLTATYTDSENEEDLDSQDPNLSDHSSKDIEESHTPPLPLSSLDIGVPKQNKYTKLVSYHDDTVMSEEESEEVEKQTFNEEPSNEDDDDVQLPPEPTGRCSNELQEKISRLYDKMINNGLDMNSTIQKRKEFRNPSIYEKLIQFCGINEFGTNYPPEVYDPIRWGPESYYEELAKVQKAEMDRRDKERKEKTKVEFVVGTAKRLGGGSNPGSGAEDEAKRRKSKWDQVGLSAAQMMIKPISLSQQTATLTASATGTKGTVISAFGSLPKKPRL